MSNWLSRLARIPMPTPVSRFLDNCPTMFSRTIAARRRREARQPPSSPVHLPITAPSSDNLDMCPVIPWLRSQTDSGETPRNRRQEETFRKVLAAGVEMLRESSYADLTVRAVAARAKVAPATAYTYFSSKNHLIAEVYLDLMRQVPYFTDVNDSRLTRVEKALRSMALMVADEPEVAAACTTALLSGSDPAVRAVRDRIGAEIHRRIRSAVGPDADPRTLVGSGDDVLRRTGQRRQRRIHLPPDRRPPQLCGRPHPGRGPMTVRYQRCRPRPVRLRLPRGPVPVLQAAARRGAAVPQRGARLLGAVAAPGRAAEGFRNSTTLSNRDGVSLDPISRGPHASKTMSFLAMDDPAHLRLRTLVSKGFTPRRIRELEPRVTELAVAASRRDAREGGLGGTVDYVAEFAGKLPMDVISELMGVPVEDRDRIRAHGRRRHAPRGRRQRRARRPRSRRRST